MIQIDCIADTHGNYPQLEGGDLLIVAGDLTASDKAHQLLEFGDWVTKQKYRKKIVIAGNHDNLIFAGRWKLCPPCEYGWDFEYLCDSGTEFEYEEYEDATHSLEGIVNYRKTFKIWGSPWTKTFPGMNPKCKAFTVDTEEELAEKWALIPDNVDILITHSPPWGVLDRNIKGEHCGSKSLAAKIGHMKNPPKLWCWGHIHESYGIDLPVRGKPVKMVNASHVNERYEPVNSIIRVSI